MSPEQVKDSKYLDYKTDVYSLAVTFYHLLTGVAPYDYNTTSEFEIQLKICQEPLDLSRLPQAWQSLLRPLLEKAPEQRGELCLPYETRRDGSESRHAETRYQENSRNSKQATRITHKEPFRVNTVGQGEVQSSSKAKLKSGLSDTTKVFMSLGALLLGYLLIVQFFFSGTPTFYDDDYDYGLNVDTMAVEDSLAVSSDYDETTAYYAQ